MRVCKHKSNKYTLVPLYFWKKDTNNKIVYVCVDQELYLTNGLKANMLVRNNVIGSEGIFINNTEKTTLIANCGVYIKIDAK